MTIRRRTFSLAALTLPLAALTFPLGADAGKPSHPQVRKALRRIHDAAANHAERLSRISKLFLSKTFKLSPLGEGPEGDRDTDPIVNFEQFDCVTYVEEVAALAAHADLDEAITRLQDIRYTDGTIDYGQRKHIMMAQWIPQNIAAGHITDVTAKLAPTRAKQARLVLTHAHFESTKGAALMLKKDERPLGTHVVPIVDVKTLAKRRQSIAHGTIITTIRADRKHVPYRASHVGLVLVRDGRRYVRHAHNKSGKVIEDRIERFVQRTRSPSAWAVSGFNLLQVTKHLA